MREDIGKCPVCGTEIPIPDDRDDFFCISCGKSLHINRTKPVSPPPQQTTPTLKQYAITDTNTAMPLATVALPDIFKVQGSIMPNVSCSAYPIEMTCAAFDPMGTVMTYFTGEGFIDSSMCPIMNGPYAQPANSVNKVVYRNFIEAVTYADEYIQKIAAGSNATSLRFIEDRPIPIESYDPQRALDMFKFSFEKELARSGELGKLQVLQYYFKPVCRIYELILSGQVFKVAIMLTMEAVKYQLPIPAMPSIPNLFSRKKPPVSQQNTVSGGRSRNSFCVIPSNALIDWKSNGVFTLQCHPEIFDAAFNTLFRQFCSSLRVSEEFLRRTEELKNKINQDIAMVTQLNLRQQQAQFAAWQQAYATRQAAFDAANQAWWDRSNATHAANRAAGIQAESSDERMSRLHSEAIRGVNTYTREDGSETEVSVDYDRAYTTVNHDTLGSNSAFEPGGNWTEMNRKE